jgi:hypothetical protein
MFSGDLIILNIPNKLMAFELSDKQIDNFKNKVEEIFKLNNWNILTAKFQKCGVDKLYTFEQMENSDFVFGKVNCVLNVNI